AVVRSTPLAEPLVTGESEARQVRDLIRAAFQRRRQQLQRSLREAFDLQPSTVAGLLAAVGSSPAARAEELSPRQFVALARVLAGA
ncbi:MAG: 16S rRNA (adenine(1518)-N(6)/adenine(1519)-N(6))-dimethyltransferase, partial [Gemmatimonadota bacterium]